MALVEPDSAWTAVMALSNAAGVRMAVEVGTRIQNDERPDAGDEQRVQQAEAI